MADDIQSASYNRPQLGLKPTRFYFDVSMFPDVAFSVQSATIPSVTLGVASYNNPLQDVQFPGEKLTYEPFKIRMMVDEEMRTYIELYGWMRELAFPIGESDLPSMAMNNARIPMDSSIKMPMSDAHLMILDSNNNPIMKFTFRGAFPIYIGELQFDTTEDGTEYLYVDVEFAYTYFRVDKP